MVTALPRERILNSGEVVEVRGWWAWQGSRKQSLEPHLHPCLPDLNCAMINIQIVLLSRWMPFSFQHTELEATKKKKKKRWALVNVLRKQCFCGCLHLYPCLSC